MKKNINIKSLIAGIIIGSICVGTVSAFANGLIVPVNLLSTQSAIYIDNQKLNLGQGQYLLNYEGRIYTPLRSVAEGLGATVDYQQNTKTGAFRVDIKSATPSATPSPSAIPTPTPDPNATPTPAPINYISVPVRDTKFGVKVTATDIVSIYNTIITLEIDNTNEYGLPMFDTNGIYIKTEDGKKYELTAELNNYFYSSLPQMRTYKGLTLSFPKLDAGTKFTLYMPLKYRDDGSQSYKNDTIKINTIVEDVTGTSQNTNNTNNTGITITDDRTGETITN